MSKDTKSDKPAFFPKWIISVRPFSLTASTMPVLFGTVISVTAGGASFRPLMFACAFFGMLFLHCGANLLNDVSDFRHGIDRRVNPVSGGVVRGWISEAEALRAAAILIGAGTIIGIYVLYVIGLPILWIGLAGIAFGLLYSWGPFKLKFHALGDLSVFLNFGILGSMGAWTVQTGGLSWIPALWAVPMSLFVIAILHANNWRDISSDNAVGVQTVASLLGDRFSERYYEFLLFSPFVIIILIIASSRLFDIGPAMPWTFLLSLAAVPLAVKLVKTARARKIPENIESFLGLDGATAQINLMFGLLCVIAPVLEVLIKCVAS